jgi:hypothetical protein
MNGAVNFQTAHTAVGNIFADLQTVVPAQAGTYTEHASRVGAFSMGSRLRGNDGLKGNEVIPCGVGR